MIKAGRPSEKKGQEKETPAASAATTVKSKSMSAVARSPLTRMTFVVGELARKRLKQKALELDMTATDLVVDAVKKVYGIDLKV